MKQTVEERFWAKVDKSGECWLWTAGKDRDGYGSFWFKNQTTRAHRFIYEFLVKVIPSGLTLDHICRKRSCVNPTHLEEATFRENALRGFGPAAINFRKTHCQHGHAFTPPNTYWRPLGGRRCCKCQPGLKPRGKDGETWNN